MSEVISLFEKPVREALAPLGLVFETRLSTGMLFADAASTVKRFRSKKRMTEEGMSRESVELIPPESALRTVSVPSILIAKADHDLVH
jgi:hypothetical protein